MKIMNEYTYQHLKKNKRNTISILAAIIIASALLCSLCIFAYSIWDGKVNTAIKNTGYWQGELGDSISGNKYKKILYNKDVETTMVKGTWSTAKLSNSKRDYLLMRDANNEFWKNMNFKDAVIKGRLPEKTGEIVVSKMFFIDNPSYKVGDKITLPVGIRMAGNKEIDTQSYKVKGETFKASKTKKYIIVGELDISGISAFPGYISMGYLSNADIKSDDELTVYMNFKNPRKIYKQLPEIAESAGLKKDASGQYKLAYNTKLLGLYAISGKKGDGSQTILLVVMAVVMIMLIMGAFILIIYNAFSLSANSRIKELSVLKSLGATPKQIKYSVLYEGFLLWAVQVPVGLIIGYGFTYAVFSKVNEILRVTQGYNNMHVCFSWIVIIFSMVISLITVLVSAYIPARKAAKVSAVSGILQNNEKVKNKKIKKYRLTRKMLGFEGELAGTQFSANKKSMRTAVLSLAMCFILITGYINIISIYNFAEAKNNKTASHNLSVDFNIIDEPNKEMVNKITSLSEIKDCVIKRQVRTLTSVTAGQESEIFSKAGGFASVNAGFYNVVKKDDKYQIIINLVGMADESFKKYCTDIGADYQKYNTSDTKGILINKTYHTFVGSKITKEIPMLNLKSNSEINLNESIDKNSDINNKFNVIIGDVTQKEPCDLNSGRYSLALVIPMKNYQKIVEKFGTSRSLEAAIMSVDLLVGDKASPSVKEKIKKICSSYMGSADFSIWSLIDDKNHDDLVQKSISFAVMSVAVMIGLIGIFNAFSIVSNNMRLRRREFAMLRSVGLTPKGLNKMLTLEGLFFALKPIVISIPAMLIICWFMLSRTATTWGEFMTFFNGGAVLLYAVLIFAAISLSYWMSSKSVKESNIIESMKDEIV